jgi:hypothetical protein
MIRNRIGGILILRRYRMIKRRRDNKEVEHHWGIVSLLVIFICLITFISLFIIISGPRNTGSAFMFLYNNESTNQSLLVNVRAGEPERVELQVRNELIEAAWDVAGYAQNLKIDLGYDSVLTSVGQFRDGVYKLTAFAFQKQVTQGEIITIMLPADAQMAKAKIDVTQTKGNPSEISLFVVTGFAVNSQEIYEPSDVTVVNLVDPTTLKKTVDITRELRPVCNKDYCEIRLRFDLAQGVEINISNLTIEYEIPHRDYSALINDFCNMNYPCFVPIDIMSDTDSQITLRNIQIKEKEISTTRIRTGGDLERYLGDVKVEDFTEQDDKYSAQLRLNSGAVVSIYDLINPQTIYYIRAFSSTTSATDVLDADVTYFSNAKITLPKKANVDYIAACSRFDRSSGHCTGMWEPTKIPFEQDENSVWFIVDEFKTYAGMNAGLCDESKEILMPCYCGELLVTGGYCCDSKPTGDSCLSRIKVATADKHAGKAYWGSS